MTAALEGLTVVDLTQGVAGPFTSRLLAQLGARVIKIERPGIGDLVRHWDTNVNGMCSGHVWVNPGKESLELDLSAPEGQETLLTLVAQADVVIENFVPGTMEKWGLTEERLHEVKDDLIYCRISGFGQDGPYSDRPALDLIVQGETGLISTNGTPEHPAKLSLSVADLSGAMYATISILTALLNKARTGEGQDVTLALFDAVMTWTGYFPYMHWYQHRAPGRVGVNHHTMFPYGLYTAADGKGVIIAAGAGSRDQWLRFCTAIDRPDLVDHPDYATNDLRLANMAVLQKIAEEVFAAHDQQYWLDRFLEFGIPSGAYRQFEEAMEHPHLVHRGLVKEVDSAVGPVKVLDFPSQFSSLDIVNRLGPPELGEHNDEVLRTAGITAERIAELRRKGIVG